MDKEKTGQLIKEARIRNKLTQAELGDILGVTNKAVSRWEKGESFPDVGVLEALSNALNIKIEDIVTGGEQDEDISKTLTDLVNTVKLQRRQLSRQKKKQIVLSIVFLIYIGLSVYPGLVAYLGRPIDIVNGIVLFMAAMFIFLLAISPKGIPEEKSTSRFDVIIRVIPVLTGLYAIILMGITLITLSKGQRPFGIEPHHVGPFLSNQLLVIFIVNVCYTAVLVFSSIRNNERIRRIAYIAAGAFNLATCYTNMLRNMASAEAGWNLFVMTTIEVTAVVIAAIVADIIMDKRRKS
ncbi:MAG: helix-turn-helix domain-containing protein [Lachnospiraceae bacterium]|nr:helix-turn-helix domain-containing protein [Lachnospiraceae bacterium]